MTACGDDRKLMHWIASHGYTVVRAGSRSYACQTSRISQAPHNCKPVKEKS